MRTRPTTPATARTTGRAATGLVALLALGGLAGCGAAGSPGPAAADASDRPTGAGGGGGGASASCVAAIRYGGRLYIAWGSPVGGPDVVGPPHEVVVPGCDDTGGATAPDPDRTGEAHEIPGLDPEVALTRDHVVYLRTGVRPSEVRELRRLVAPGDRGGPGAARQ